MTLLKRRSVPQSYGLLLSSCILEEQRKVASFSSFSYKYLFFKKKELSQIRMPATPTLVRSTGTCTLNAKSLECF